MGEVLAELRRRKLNGELDGRESELAAARELIAAGGWLTHGAEIPHFRHRHVRRGLDSVPEGGVSLPLGVLGSGRDGAGEWCRQRARPALS